MPTQTHKCKDKDLIQSLEIWNPKKQKNAKAKKINKTKTSFHLEIVIQYVKFSNIPKYTDALELTVAHIPSCFSYIIYSLYLTIS